MYASRKRDQFKPGIGLRGRECPRNTFVLPLTIQAFGQECFIKSDIEVATHYMYSAVEASGIVAPAIVHFV